MSLHLLLVSIGHETLMAKVTFFGTNSPVPEDTFDFSCEYSYQDELYNQSVSSK